MAVTDIIFDRESTTATQPKTLQTGCHLSPSTTLSTTADSQRSGSLSGMMKREISLLSLERASTSTLMAEESGAQF
jgi:hypothetical protein